jgi:ATP-dependent Lon protease
MSDNIHEMKTRSKASTNINNDQSDDDSSVDEYGNLKGFIDYDCEDDFDHEELDKELNRLRKTKPKGKLKKNKRLNDKKINDVFMSYIIMKATEKANESNENRKSQKQRQKQKNQRQKQKNQMQKNQMQKKNKVTVEISDCSDDSDEMLDGYDGSDDLIEKINLDECIDSHNSHNSHNSQNLTTILTMDLSSDSDSNDSSFKGSLDTVSSLSDSDQPNSSDSDQPKEEEEEEEEDEYTFEYDKQDEEYEELIDKQLLKNSEETNMEYYHYLDKEAKEKLFKLTSEIYEYNGSNIPLRFKVIESEMDMKTKAIALENIDKMVEMDVSTGEHSKMDLWINGLMRIPFGKYNRIPINPESGVSEKREFITNTYKTLDKAIYGHKEAKTHILQVIGKWMKNPDSSGNVLAIQGPMGNGKTTLVKDGISKVLNRPFHFIALGGASDSAYFDGHCYTYEGSHWGRIVQILQDSKCMNPVIYFDELDKISDTNKGEEIIHMLTHLTDPSQNNLFQDNYFPGVNLDLSKALFIFSYNDESKVNRILKDRMYVIHTKGFKTDDKIKICNEYLIPEIFNTFAFEKDDLVFTTDIIKKIVEKFTGGEEGVRNLKRCIETIVSKINIHILSDGDSGLSFKLKELVLPVTLTEEHIEILLKVDNGSDKPPYGMYS